MKREALFYKKLKDNKVKCTLCHNNCILSPSQIGMCFGKKNIDGTLYAINYGQMITLNDDPIEKKPFYHYYPGTNIISIAQAGCNMRCPFCQNYDISMKTVNSTFLSIEDLHSLLINKNRTKIAFTYTEPLMWYEYIYDFSKTFTDIETSLITNGCINSDAGKKIAPYIAAANIDLKSFNKDFYKNELKGDLDYVKKTIEIFFNANVHIEITNLLIEGKNDNIDDFKKMIEFIYTVSPNIPFHISRYFPSYKYSLKPTSLELMYRFYDIAKEKLNYVYLGNIADTKYSSTFCNTCGNLLIKRDYYNTQIIGIENKHCNKCGNKIDIIGI